MPITIRIRDTVNSVGLIPHRLPFTTSNTIVRTFRHAVALDERRAKFKANPWNRPTKTDLLISRQPIDPVLDQITPAEAPTPSPRDKKNKSDKLGSQKIMERDHSEKRLPTNIEEV